jgi:DNA polymerase-1
MLSKTQTPPLPTHFYTSRDAAWENVKAAGMTPVLTDFNKQPQHKGYALRYVKNPELEQMDRKHPGNIAAIITNTFVDMDLENQDIVKLAPYFLPKTPYEWGREGNKRSHRLYRSPNGTKTIKLSDVNQELVMEVRTGESLSTLPPSVHPSGEAYQFTGGEFVGVEEALEVDYEELFQAATVMMLAYGLLEFYQKGNRDSLTLCAIGILARHQFPQELATKFLSALVALTADEEGESRLKKIPVIYESIKDPEAKVAGYRMLANLCGDKFKDWARAILRKSAPTGSVEKPDIVDVRDYLVDEYAEEFVFGPGHQEFFHWTGTHWQAMDDEHGDWLDVVVPNAMRAIGMRVAAGSQIDSVLRITRPHIKKDLVSPAYWLNMANGVFDADLWQLHPHDKQHGFREVSKFDIEPGQTPKIDRFLEQTVPDPWSIVVFEEHVGLAMMQDTLFHKALIIVGPTGSGKSTMADLAVAACGEDPDQQPNPSLLDKELEGDRSRATWQHQKLSHIGEFPADAIREGETFKIMTGHGSARMRQLRAKESTKNRWRPKLLMTTNDQPRFTDPGGAIRRRLLIIEAPFSKSEEQFDLTLREQLAKELPQWSARCLLRARDALERGSYTYSAQMRRKLNEIVYSGDPIQYWAGEYLIRDDGKWISTEDLYNSYKAVTSSIGKGVAQAAKVMQGMLSVHPYAKPKRGKATVGNRPHGYENIRFRIPTDPDFDPDGDVVDNQSLDLDGVITSEILPPNPPSGPIAIGSKRGQQLKFRPKALSGPILSGYCPGKKIYPDSKITPELSGLSGLSGQNEEIGYTRDLENNMGGLGGDTAGPGNEFAFAYKGNLADLPGQPGQEPDFKSKKPVRVKKSTRTVPGQTRTSSENEEGLITMRQATIMAPSRETPISTCPPWTLPTWIAESKLLAVDTETAVKAGTIYSKDNRTSLDPHTGRLRLLTISNGQQTSVIDLWQNPDALGMLRPIIEDPARTIIAHNASFDMQWLMKAGFDLQPNWHDTMRMAQVFDGALNQNQRGYFTLKAVAERELGLQLDKTEQTSDWSLDLTQSQRDYAAKDAALLIPIHESLVAKLEADNLQRVMAIEHGALPAIAAMEYHGMPFNKDIWMALAEKAKALVADLKPKLVEAFGNINFNSPIQLKKALKNLGIDLASTDQEHLTAVKDQHPAIQLLLTYSKAEKNATTYAEDFVKKHVNPVTGNVHTHYGLVATGRMSSSNPNTQNIPRGDYRKAFAVPDGQAFIKTDYSGIELRIGAIVAQEKNMLDAFNHSADLHKRTAMAILGKEASEITKRDRDLCKSLNFNMLYGGGAQTLKDYALASFGVEMTLEEAKKHRAAWFAAYPAIRAWHTRATSYLAKEGSMGAEDMWLPNTAPQNIRSMAGRIRRQVMGYSQVLNTPIQATGADGLKLALARIYADRQAFPEAKIIGAIHDEICVSCPSEQTSAVAAWVQKHMVEAMTEVVAGGILIEVESTIGRDWGGTPISPVV